MAATAEIAVEDAVVLLAETLRHDCPQFQEALLAACCEQFASVSLEDLAQLPASTLGSLLASKELTLETEDSCYEAVFGWCAANAGDSPAELGTRQQVGFLALQFLACS